MVIIFGDDDPNTYEEVGLEIHKCDNCDYEEVLDSRKVKKPVNLWNSIKNIFTR